VVARARERCSLALMDNHDYWATGSAELTRFGEPGSTADQAHGLQHVYGGGALRSPSAEVVPAMHSDHDVLLVRAHLTAQR
jgi:hypothetical protein